MRPAGQAQSGDAGCDVDEKSDAGDPRVRGASHARIPASAVFMNSHRGTSTPNTRSHTVSAPSPMMPGAKLYGDRDVASAGDRNVSQPKPANAISAPRTRGRKVDRKMR